MLVAHSYGTCVSAYLIHQVLLYCSLPVLTTSAVSFFYLLTPHFSTCHCPCVPAYLIHQRPHLLARVVLIDPICFQSGFHKIGLYPFTTLRNILCASEELGYSALKVLTD